MSERVCAHCGSKLEDGFITTTNGSGLFWTHDLESSRLRPTGLEVLVPTGFMGTFSANLAGGVCRSCGAIDVYPRTKPATPPR
jgi:hypothetical protein